MLVSLKEILKIAEEKNIAIGAFNTPNLTSLKAVIDAANETKMPIIIMHAQVHEEMGLCKMEEIAPIMIMFAKAAAVPVCVHLDHGTDIDYIKKGLELGFTSVMYDGSELSESENIENTKYVVELAKKYNASVEAEVGSMGSREGCGDGASIYTDPETAVNFVKDTGIDALACAFGTAHGVYLKEPKLDFDRLNSINTMVDIPLVMHGGSGVSEEDYNKVISLGIRKINYYTYMAIAGAKAVTGKDFSQFHEIEVAACNGMKEDIIKAINIFTK